MFVFNNTSFESIPSKKGLDGDSQFITRILAIPPDLNLDIGTLDERTQRIVSYVAKEFHFFEFFTIYLILLLTGFR